ncbi:response regulator transcription factor [Agrobacterium tumefaciens]
MTSEKPIVVVVDDDEDVRASLRELMLSVGLDVSIFSSSRELLDAKIPDRPGCLVLDIRMPGSSGLDLHQQLLSIGNARPVVFLSGYGDIPMTVQAMKAGAVDFLTKPFRDQTLLDAVMAGIERDVVNRREARLIDESIERLKTLTPREREVFQRVALGRLNKQVAFELGISAITVKLHRSNLMRKMKFNSVGELIRAWEAMPPERRDR